MSVGAASSTSQVAVLGPRGGLTSARVEPTAGRPAIRLVTFGALALYGIVKWSTLLAGGAMARLLGLLVLALLLAAGRPALAQRSRLLAAAATVLVLLAVFPLAGVPLAWVTHMRIAVTARAVGEGLSALPQVLVPYSGVNQWVTLVIVLGAAVLLFDGALLVAFAPREMEDLRRAGAALPLVALAAVPTTLVRPELPYVDGLILFALLVAFMWGERIGRRRAGGALGVCALAVLAAMIAAPALDRHKPWVDYRALAGGLGPTTLDAFDWSQGYGPIDWPREGHVVLEIQARQPEYWKAENLDAFNGIGWAQGEVPGAGMTPPIDPSALKRWTQTIQVTIRDMRTQDVIGAGTSRAPTDVPQGVSRALSPGTWTAGSDLGPGDSYLVSVYAPEPSAAQLNAAGADYAGLAPGYLTIELPQSPGTPSPSENVLPSQQFNADQPVLVVPPFRSGGSIAAYGGPPGAVGGALIRTSTYAGTYRLAQRLAAGAGTPYQYVQAVERYLAHGFAYNENPPRASYPLPAFLFTTHRGYCQQFAGAMALLLRMGGVPARVAVGFSSGHRDAATGRWLVTDYDAHAWVEAWFPHYGWVRFDPTPGADPALGGRVPHPNGLNTNVAATGVGLSASKTGVKTHPRRHRGSSQRRRSTHAGGSGGTELPWIAAVIIAVLLGLLLVATKPLRSVDALVGELERALTRIGRPMPAGATLSWLERRVGASADAVAYIRVLRLARFGRGDGVPTRGQRRALRRQLRSGRGPLGLLRAVWALPPRWGVGPARPARTRAWRGSGA